LSPPPKFCHIGTKLSVRWPSKYAKIHFRQPRWGSSRCSPDPLVGWRGDAPPHTPPTFGARHASPRSPARSTPMIVTTLPANWHAKIGENFGVPVILYFRGSFLPRCMKRRRGLAMKILSVRLSVSLSVKRVDCCKTE